APVVIDHGVAEHAVEPRLHRLVAAHVLDLVEAAGERLLEEILRGGAIADPPLEEGEERPVVVDQRLDPRSRRSFGHLHPPAPQTQAPPGPYAGVVSLSPTIESTSVARKKRRPGVAGSPKRSIPPIAAPAAPMP